MNRILLGFFAFLLLCSGSVLIWLTTKDSENPSGSEKEVDQEFVAEVEKLTQFEFTDQLAKPFHSDELSGQIWLGSFFFADCPSICAQQNLEISKLQKRFQEQGVRIVSITVAPDDDPPHKLLTYANRFSADHDNWKFLTGRDLPYVIRVANDFFGIPAADETHTSEVAVFDRLGKMHGTYNVMEGLEYAKCVRRVDELLAAQQGDDQQEAPESQAAPEVDETTSSVSLTSLASTSETAGR